MTVEDSSSTRTAAPPATPPPGAAPPATPPPGATPPPASDDSSRDDTRQHAGGDPERHYLRRQARKLARESEQLRQALTDRETQSTPPRTPTGKEDGQPSPAPADPLADLTDDDLVSGKQVRTMLEHLERRLTTRVSRSTQVSAMMEHAMSYDVFHDEGIGELALDALTARIRSAPPDADVTAIIDDIAKRFDHHRAAAPGDGPHPRGPTGAQALAGSVDLSGPVPTDEAGLLARAQARYQRWKADRGRTSRR